MMTVIENPIQAETTLSQISIIPRAAIPAIHSIEQDGKIHPLGELRDFKWHPALKNFLSPLAEFSISWVCLKYGETLAEHVHPTQSMMIFYQGDGQLLGQKNQKVSAGDIVVVPPGCAHGFIGGETGLHGFSIQFSAGLYTDLENPRVAFKADQSRLQQLRQYHQIRLQRLLTQPFFTKLLNHHTLENPTCRKKLLDCLSIWDRRMNTPLFNRDDSNQSIQENCFDPILEALIDWPIYQLQTLDHTEKYIITQWVFADIAEKYHEKIHSCLTESVDRQFFSRHFRLDYCCEHQTLPFLNLSSKDYYRLKRILILTWNYLETLLNRIYEITQQPISHTERK